jgi:hypothetical protein
LHADLTRPKLIDGKHNFLKDHLFNFTKKIITYQKPGLLAGNIIQHDCWISPIAMT